MRITFRIIKALVICLFGTTITLFAVERPSLSDGTMPYKLVLTPYATYPVLVEELTKKIVLEGQWGTAPGEFGALKNTDRETAPLDPYLGPTGMYLNSKGEIYVMDKYNNRIQKFDKDGKYIKSIEVKSAADKDGNPIMKRVLMDDNVAEKPYYEGFGILIDSKDNLYYHCKTNGRRELWLFKNDRFIKKWDINKVETGVVFIGLYSRYEEEIWVGDIYSNYMTKGDYFNATLDKYFTIKDYNELLEDNIKRREISLLLYLKSKGLYYYALFRYGIKGMLLPIRITLCKNIGNKKGVQMKNGDIRILGQETDKYYEYIYFSPSRMVIKVARQSKNISFTHQDSDGNILCPSPETDIRGIKFIWYEPKPIDVY